LKVIQIGLTFCDPNGRLPTDDGHPFNTWQFNFKFDLGYDLYAADSVQFLQKCGIDFTKHQTDGIDYTLFGELLMSSGIVLSDDVRWIAFQGKYDFGYLIKLLTCDQLPKNQEIFFDLLSTYFPNIYDIKWLLHHVHSDLEEEVTKTNKDKGLEDLAKTLKISRIGVAHQAGSDSLLTAQVFFSLVHRHLPHVLHQGGEAPEVHTPVRSGARNRSSSVGSDGLIIERRQHGTHLRNVLHGLGRGYIQPDRDPVAARTPPPPPPPVAT
jgi:CCR4-NOT transcription complex subunit 7/8